MEAGITPFGWDPEQEGRCAISAQSDQAKGHAKEAAGLLTGDEDLQAEGRAERVAGEAQERTDKVKDTVEGGLDKVQDKVNSGVDKVQEKTESGLDKVQDKVNEILDKAKKAVHRS